MSVANDYAITKKSSPGKQPVVSAQSLAFEKSYLIDSVPVSGLHYLQDHRVAGKVIYPAAGFCMAGIAVHRALRVPADKHKPMVLENIRFRRTLSLSDRDKAVLRLSYKPERGEFTVYSSRRDELDAAAPHAVGMITGTNPELPACDIDFDAPLSRCVETINVSDFYQRLSQSGLDYGPFFKRIDSARVSRHTGEAFARLSSHPALSTTGDLRARPITLLDCAFQSLAAALDTGHINLYVPSRIRSLRVYADLQPDLWCHARLMKSTNRAVVGDITIFNVDKRPLMEIHGLHCLRVPRSHINRGNTEFEWRDKSSPQNSNFHRQLFRPHSGERKC